MTLNELNAHLELLERLIRARELLDSLRMKAHPGAQVLTGMPHSPGVTDKVGDLAVEIADMSDLVEFLQYEVEKSESRIIEFISSVQDDQVRLILRLRFMRGLSWKEVADVLGKWYTEASAKSKCYKFIKSEESRAKRAEIQSSW